MADANNTKYTAEPEERIEAALVAILATHCTVAIEGALTPADEGSVRTIDDDSLVSVVVDQQSQDLDFRGNRVPHTYRAQVSIRYSMADDPNAASAAASAPPFSRSRATIARISGLTDSHAMSL